MKNENNSIHTTRAWAASRATIFKNKKKYTRKLKYKKSQLA
jgi:hypothetical protein